MKEYGAANAKADETVNEYYGPARRRGNRSRSPLSPKTGKPKYTSGIGDVLSSAFGIITSGQPKPAAKEPASASKRPTEVETGSKKKSKNDEVNKRPGAEQPLGQKKQKKQAAQ